MKPTKNITVRILKDPKSVAKNVACQIRDKILEKNKQGKTAVLLLATGSTPLPVYEELIRMHKEEGLSFKNVVTFNLDEYYKIEPTHDQSYRYYMNTNFFNHIDIDIKNTHVPKGNLEVDDYEQFCKDYEKKIKSYGGFDLTLLGIGKTGHIAFNEPGSKKTDYTRLIVLHNQTRRDNSRFFKSMKDVPKYAVTCGIGTIIFNSRKIILIATGYSKSKIIKKTLEEPHIVKTQCPASFLRDHPNCEFVLDKPAAYLIKQIKSPWEIETVSSAILFKWDYKMAKKAIVWLGLKLGKSILQLTEDDLCDNHLSSLFYYCEDVEELCRKVFNDIIGRIHTSINPILPVKKNGKKAPKVLLFSPHPDDDVISAGGFLLKVASEETHVAYMTSGSRGVKKADILRHLKFTSLSLELPIFKENEQVKQKMLKVMKEVEESIDYSRDTELIAKLKTNVRMSEALNALNVLNVPKQNAHFLDLPFYQTGTDKKKGRSDDDVDMVVKLLEDTKPEHVAVCFDLEDPHGTHSQCYFIAKEAIEKYEKKHGLKVVKYLYKGAWQEFDIDQIDIFVPLSQKDLEQKIDSIFMHASQKDKPMFPGDDCREFFERARDKNKLTAKEVCDLGFPNFFSMEGLKVVEKLPESVTI